jgi:hypothetical protein
MSAMISGEMRSSTPALLLNDLTTYPTSSTSPFRNVEWLEYLRGHFQETPALCEVIVKKPSLINFDFSNGLYTVPKELDNSYLAIGKQMLKFIPPRKAGRRGPRVALGIPTNSRRTAASHLI